MNNVMYNEHIAHLTKETPYLVIESNKVIYALETFQRLFGEENVYYAVKANPHRSIIELLSARKGTFEISSLGELELMSGLGIPPSRLISAGTIKTTDFVKAAFNAGVRYFTADCLTEVKGIATYAPGSKLVVRIVVSNKGSEWPLERKFGVNADESTILFIEARERGLIPWGLSFHVGSQCTLPGTWLDAIDTACFAWNRAARSDIYLKSLNMGGGFPVQYRKSVPVIDEFATTILDNVRDRIPDVEEILVEPGRAIVGNAGTMVASVIAKAIRNKKRWLYLDVGVFNGLLESIGGIKYPYVVNRRGRVYRWIVAGPSCDGMDVIDKTVLLPDFAIGDRVLILSAGAYTTAYASMFGGAPIPEIYMI
jgi:ornithine decarboxylase